MRKDERDLLEVLKLELKFLESGGYKQSSRQPSGWRHVFEDSPSCFNYGRFDYDCRGDRSACTDCVLIHLVPPESRAEKVPCRHIPLNASGETLESLYRRGDVPDVEETVGKWLRATIERLEDERRQRSGSKQRRILGHALKGVPLYQKAHPKCANPACPTAFQWLAGGKVFRFRPDQISPIPNELTANPTTEDTEVKHFWLCERCSHMFTLVFDENYGVVLTLRGPELPLVQGQKVSAA